MNFFFIRALFFTDSRTREQHIVYSIDSSEIYFFKGENSLGMSRDYAPLVQSILQETNIEGKAAPLMLKAHGSIISNENN